MLVLTIFPGLHFSCNMKKPQARGVRLQNLFGSFIQSYRRIGKDNLQTHNLNGNILSTVHPPFFFKLKAILYMGKLQEQNLLLIRHNKLTGFVQSTQL